MSIPYKERFLQQAFNTHGLLYSYTLLPIQFNYNSIIPIICSKHGIFFQKANQHAIGSNCQKCAHESRYNTHYNKKRHTIQTFIQKAIKVHGHYYDYSKSVYIGQMKPINIICPNHGTFNTIANNHLYGTGCNKCKRSRGETKIINTLTNLNVLFEIQKTFPTLRMPDCHSRTFNHPKFDFYLPVQNILIEFDGKHHFTPVQFRGVSVEVAIQLHNRIVLTDKLKQQYAIDNNITLIRIPYTEYKNIESIITTLLDISQ